MTFLDLFLYQKKGVPPKVIKILNSRLIDAKKRSKKRELVFEITLKDLIRKYIEQNGRCYYYKQTVMSISTGSRLIISIDRLDPNFGYINENTVLCTISSNMAKGRMPATEYINMIQQQHNLNNPPS